MLPSSARTQGAPGLRGGSATSISRTVMSPLVAGGVVPVAHLHGELVDAVVVVVARILQRRARHLQAQLPVRAQREQVLVGAAGQRPGQGVPVLVPRRQPARVGLPQQHFELLRRDHRLVVVVQDGDGHGVRGAGDGDEGVTTDATRLGSGDLLDAHPERLVRLE